jgi:hypothetical protein
MIVKTKVKDINLKYVKPERAGIILYTVKYDSIYFGLGLDAKFHELTDFGGNICYPKDVNVIKGAIREFEEETLNIFDVTEKDIEDSLAVYDDKNLIIFAYIDIDPNDISERFNEQYKKTNSKREVCSITWLSWCDLQSAINQDNILFSRIKKFFVKLGDLSNLL